MSPIAGLTTTGRSQFPELGRLRKGAPKETNRAGTDLTYFRFDSPDQVISAQFSQAYGDKPTRINCFVPRGDVDECLSAFRELYTASGLQHRCDGEFCYDYNIDGKLAPTNRPCPCKDLPDMIESKSGYPMKNPNKCTPKGAMNLIIPELHRFGFVRFLTSSVHDIIKLHGELTAIREMVGTLSGIPLVLYRKPEPIKRPTQTEGKRGTDIRHMVHIEISPDFAREKFSAMQQQALASLQAPTSLALPEPAIYSRSQLHYTIDHDTGEIYDDEPDEGGATFEAIAEVVAGQPKVTTKKFVKPEDWTDRNRLAVIKVCRDAIRNLNPSDPRFGIILEDLTNGELFALSNELTGI